MEIHGAGVYATYKELNVKGLTVPSSDGYVLSHQAPIASRYIHELFLSSGSLDTTDYLSGRPADTRDMGWATGSKSSIS